MTREEAIEVLSQDLPCEHDTDLIEALKIAIRTLEQEPYDDAKYHEEHGEVVVDRAVWEDAKRALEQEPKTGHWIYKPKTDLSICDKCGSYCPQDKYGRIETDFCPKCGARMVEPQERSEDAT